MLRYGYDLPYADIAAALGSSEDAARQAASSGVRRLRKRGANDRPTDLDRRFRDAAAAEGLLDVAYDLVDTPVGRLLVAVTDHGALRDLLRPGPRARGGAARPRFGARVLRSPSRRTRRGASSTSTSPASARTSTWPLDLRQARDFGRAVLHELAQVPYGELTTYGTLAARAGRPRAARAVGTV